LTVTFFAIAVALSALAFGGVLFGLMTGSAALGAPLPRSVTVGLSLIVALLAFGFFASSQKPSEAPHAWLWLVALAASVSLAAISIRWSIRSLGRTARPRLPIVVGLVVVPLSGFVGALLAIVLSHAPDEVLLLPAALLALSVAGRLWLANESHGYG